MRSIRTGQCYRNPTEAFSYTSPGRLRWNFRYIAIEGPAGVGKSAAGRSARRAPRRDGRPRRNGESVPRGLLRGAPRRGVPGAALLHALAPPAADGAAAERPVQPAHDLRLPLRSRQDLRLPESRRQRAVHLPAAVRAARAGPPVAGPGDLPADADRRPAAPAARARAHATPSSPPLDDEYVRELNEAYNHFFFHYTATPLLVVETSQFDLSWGDEALADLERQLRGMGKGTRYYVPRA